MHITRTEPTWRWLTTWEEGGTAWGKRKAKGWRYSAPENRHCDTKHAIISSHLLEHNTPPAVQMLALET